MRIKLTALLVTLLLAGLSMAQNGSTYAIALRSGTVIPDKDISAKRIAAFNRSASRASYAQFVLIQFEQLPGNEEKQLMKDAGIKLIQYVPQNTYTALARNMPDSNTLARAKVRAIVELKPEQKMAPGLTLFNHSPNTLRPSAKLDLWISYPTIMDAQTVIKELTSRQIEIIPSLYSGFGVIGVRISSDRLSELASLDFIEYVQKAPGGDVELNNKSRVLSRANVLQSAAPGGRNLRGEGITIGIGDNGSFLPHLDLTGRVIDRFALGNGNHGMHVAGTAAGAGLLQEKYTGYLPKASVIGQAFSKILAYSPEYVQDHGMVVTNNSYGNVVDDCTTFGVYDLYSNIMDQLAFALPNLQNVFAAGNSGNYQCGLYATGYRTVLGAYQSAKNIISVGSTTESGVLYFNSSRGPVADGRIKPEIVAQGVAVISTYPTNLYGFSTGTSMASPAVTGGLGLLYQRYRQLHSNLNPSNALMKALLCNGATDLGNPGPDYLYGFGQMNLLRSITMLENNNYIESSVAASATNTHSITIPVGSNIAQLKVMLYWNDAPAAMLAAHTLVNDLDLEVQTPSATTVLPFVLDTLPVNVGNNATRGADHINNIEQVVIDNPVAGIYTFRVKGTTIPLAASSNYVLVYDTLPVSVTLTHPMGGEHFAPEDSIYISWEAYGNTTNTYSIQYSPDGGDTWPVTIAADVPASERQHKWFVPTGATSEARIRLIQNGTGLESISTDFVVLGTPTVSLAPVQCEGYIALNWTAVTDATDYEIMILQGDEMVSVATTTSTAYTIGGLSKDSVYWVAVRARINGSPGWRSTAISRQPNNGTCTGNISDNDLKIDAILSPVRFGRKFTSTEPGAAVDITIRIKNLDDTPTVGDIPVRYVIGALPAINEIITSPSIPAGGTYSYTFSAKADFSAVGTYPLSVSVSYPGDPVTANDTLTIVYKHLDNPVIDLAADFLDDIEAAAVQSHNTRQTGLEGLDRYDFTGSTVYSRIRTFVNSGIAYSGNKALTLDADRYNAGGTVDSLTATFNLQLYNAATDDVRLDFQFKHHGQLSHAANKVWVRGSDLDNWIEAYDLYQNQAVPGVFRQSASIELRKLLLTNGQNYSSSTQVRWGQWGQTLVSDNEAEAGYTFDDIHLYHVTNDIQMVKIDTPAVSSCGLNAAVPVSVVVKNTSSMAAVNIPILLQVDGGAVINEFIPSIAADATITYTFTATANLASYGTHTLKVWVDFASDTYRLNDTAMVELINSPLITSFPYLENFETNNGYWYTNGVRSSWEYGTPSAVRINRAASGSKVWKTSLAGNYNDGEFSYLYSPCFDISGMSAPTLSFSHALDLEDCGGTLCDAAFIEYSADGQNWMLLGSTGEGTNWYNKNYAGNQVWNVQNYTRWHVATIPLPTGFSTLRLRFVLRSDPYTSREGIAVDDIHIYDKQFGIYDGPPYTSNTITEASVSGSEWIHFTDGGKLIASINPAGQNLGSTVAQAYIHTESVRNSNSQYYHDRNITIKPAQTALTDSALIRFYFTDYETEALLNASGCATCTKPQSAYDLGISKYSNADKDKENGSLADNTGGQWHFISNAVKVPYDNGYYAEFKVKDFSEFWLNHGGPINNQPLPVELRNFTVTRLSNGDVKLDWQTASESNSAYYDIELAKGNVAMSQQLFTSIGRVASENQPNGSTYSFLDKENNKSGVRYYRLRMVDENGSFRYSGVRPIVFDEAISWQLYPNPSKGIFNLVCQAPAGESISVRIHDGNGRQIRSIAQSATGFVQKIEINMEDARYSAGIYLLEVSAGSKASSFRMIKL